MTVTKAFSPNERRNSERKNSEVLAELLRDLRDLVRIAEVYRGVSRLEKEDVAILVRFLAGEIAAGASLEAAVERFEAKAREVVGE